LDDPSNIIVVLAGIGFSDDFAKPEPRIDVGTWLVFIDVDFPRQRQEAGQGRGAYRLSQTGFKVGLALSNLGLGKSRDECDSDK
jgi:hypothetical protein